MSDALVLAYESASDGGVVAHDDDVIAREALKAVQQSNGDGDLPNIVQAAYLTNALRGVRV
jgi:hypothetical protein